MKPRLNSFAGAATAFLTLVVAAPANAQSLEELGHEAVFELCPQLMEIETPLANDDRIVARGYKAEATREHPRAGTLDVVTLQVADGRIWIANSRDASLCQVGLQGAAAHGAYESLLHDRHLLDETLVPDPEAKATLRDSQVLSFRTPAIDKVYLGVQYIAPTELKADSSLIIQQYLLEE